MLCYAVLCYVVLCSGKCGGKVITCDKEKFQLLQLEHCAQVTLPLRPLPPSLSLSEQDPPEDCSSGGTIRQQQSHSAGTTAARETATGTAVTPAPASASASAPAPLPWA